MSIPGQASPEATRRWFEKAPAPRGEGRRPLLEDLRLPTIGWGGNSGEVKNIVDLKIESAVPEILAGGCNLFDTSPAYRHRRSQTALGKALPRALARASAARENLVITTHMGFVSLDRKEEDPDDFFQKRILPESGLAEADFVAQGWSCHPDWIRQQLALARKLSRLDSFDILLLDAPELALRAEGRERGEALLLQAFAALEELCEEGHARCWGLASLDGFYPQGEQEASLQLDRLLDLARQAGGGGTRCKVIQAPYSLAQLAFLNESPSGRPSLQQQILERELFFMGSLSLGQGQLCEDLPAYLAEAMPGCESDAARALQFARSTPGVGCVLVGMKTREHIRDNLALEALPCLTEDAWRALFS